MTSGSSSISSRSGISPLSSPAAAAAGCAKSLSWHTSKKEGFSLPNGTEKPVVPPNFTLARAKGLSLPGNGERRAALRGLCFAGAACPSAACALTPAGRSLQGGGKGIFSAQHFSVFTCAFIIAARRPLSSGDGILPSFRRPPPPKPAAPGPPPGKPGPPPAGRWRRTPSAR